MTDLDMSFRPTSYWRADATPAGEVEIAQVAVDSGLGDVNSIVATPIEGGGIRFDARTEEGHQLADIEPSRADDPLTLGELIKLIDTADLGSGLKPGIVYGLLDMNALLGSGKAEDADFISVSSEFYPELSNHYDRQMQAWVAEG